MNASILVSPPSVSSTVPVMRKSRKSHVGFVFMAAFLAAVVPGGRACAADAVQDAPAGQAQSYLDDAQLDAYDAAKKETDPRKRATRLFEFFQKYPNSVLLESADYQEIKTVEDEYNTYYAARQEADLNKRADLLLEFLRKYPESTLREHVDTEYVNMMRQASREKKYDLLESVSEKWLKTHTTDREAYAFVAEAAMNLEKYGRCAECLEAIYKMQPSAELAREIYSVYQKTDNLDKQSEWAEKLFQLPEFEKDYMLRYSLVVKYTRENNLDKAAEYASLTLKALDAANPPDAKAQEDARKMRRACHHVLGNYHLEKRNYAAAVLSYKDAVKAEKYPQGYYMIGVCLENQKDVEQAILYYAAAESMGGEEAPKAKARLEVLYKALHNDTLIGIEKVYKKAKEILAES